MSLCKTMFFSAKTGIRLSFFLHRKTDRVPENTLSENTPSVFVVLVLILFCTENPVSCISQTRADICVFVQLTIHMTYVDLHLKLMPQAAQNDDGANPMASSMKTMNMVMPLMSAFFCFTFPVGLGIYWISSAVVRSVQQVLINRHLNKMDIEVLINENMKKIEEKRAKAGLPPQKITNQAHQSVKNNQQRVEKGNSGSPEAERAKKVEESYKKAAAAKPDSITAKANLVRTFDERNKKK